MSDRTNPVKLRPILFSAPMVRAILSGQKTVTRRIVKPQPLTLNGLQRMACGAWREVGPDYPDDASDDRWCPYGKPGDRLWVRETWYDDFGRAAGEATLMNVDRLDDGRVEGVEYRATHDCSSFEAGCPCNPDGDGKRSEWRPSIFMPRAFSRIELEIASVRAEPLQSMTEQDAIAEGIEAIGFPRDEFRKLWDKINGEREPWQRNPWVWVVSFRRIESARSAA